MTQMKDSEQLEGERRLAAIMFTDMVGFTALTQRNEILALELLEEQRRLIRSLLGKYRGREVDSIGDGFLMEFASSLDAVRCAVEIQSALKHINAKRPEEKRIWIRIGIHLGDIIHTGTKVEGDAVNVASRIEPLAPPGGICITAQVYASVVNKVDYVFKSLGMPELKNVVMPIEVFRVSGFGQSVIRPIQIKTMMPTDRIAVLPFTNISMDPADEYLADGMTEEMISSVSQMKGLRVIARTSGMRYKGTQKPIAARGRELNVGSVLEGSVRKAGDKIRISIQFVDTLNEEPQWTQEYDRELKDIFTIQSDIAHRVAEALRNHVLRSAIEDDEKRATSSTEAYTNYLRGRQLWNQRTEESLKRAIGFFEDALRNDKNYAQAYTGLADSYATLAFLEFMVPHEAYPKAKEAAW